MRRIALVLPVLCLLGGLAALCISDADASKGTIKKQKNPVAVIEMEKGGVIEMELYTKDQPITAGNFVKLANKGFYNGVKFHRVEPGFVAQTGDPTGTGRGGPGYTIKDEYSAFKHDKGAVGMAKTSAPDSAGSQWYICLEAAHFLDCQKTGTGFKGYTVFGKVIKGMDVAEKIKIGDKMKKVTIRMPEAPKHKEHK